MGGWGGDGVINVGSGQKGTRNILCKFSRLQGLEEEQDVKNS